MSMIFWNNAASTLLASITNVATSLSIQSADTALFPQVTAPDYMWLALDDGTFFEVVKVTAHTAGTQVFTVVRGQDNTTARAFTLTTTKIEIRIPAAALNNFVDNDGTDTISGVKTFSALATFSGGATFSTTMPSSSVGFDITAGNLKLGTGNTIELADQASNPAGIASKTLLYARNFAGRRFPKWVGPTGVDYFIQEALWGNNTVLWKPGAANGFTFLGDTPTITGTITTPTAAAGSFGAELNKRNIASAATANTAVGLLGAANQYARIAAAGHGGFFFFCRFRNGANTATSYRTFLGLSNQGAIPITDPSAGAFSMVGIGFNAADTTLFITLKDATTANRIAVTGSNKTAGSTYDCAIFCPPGTGSAGNIFYRVDDVNAGTTLLENLSGTGTNAPLASAMMRPVALVGTLTAAACNLELAQFYCSADF